MRLLALVPAVLIAVALAGCGDSADKTPTAVEIEETLAPKIAKNIAQRLYLKVIVDRFSCERPVDHQARCELITREGFPGDVATVAPTRREVVVDIDPDSGKLKWRVVKNFT